MMLAELRQLLASDAYASTDGFRRSVVQENVLGKASVSGRERSYRYLRELYGLDLGIPSFRGLARLWNHDEQAQPLIALASALMRDPALRGTASSVIGVSLGRSVTADELAEAVQETYPGSYRDTVAHKIGRNAASTWTQSGHLVGRTNKIRTRANPRPASVAYALYLASLDDVQGDLLFESLPVQSQDAPAHVLRELAREASRLGWLDYRSLGNVAEIGFGFFEATEGTGL
jgi:hypothetical protein